MALESTSSHKVGGQKRASDHRKTSLWLSSPLLLPVPSRLASRSFQPLGALWNVKYLPIKPWPGLVSSCCKHGMVNSLVESSLRGRLVCLLPWEGWDWRSSPCIVTADDGGRWKPVRRTSLNFPAPIRKSAGCGAAWSWGSPSSLLLLGISNRYSPSL